MITAADSIGTTPLAPASPENGGLPPNDSKSGTPPGGSDGGTNTPPAEPTVAAPPAMPVLSIPEDDYNPGLLDPLAWTLADDEPQADDSGSFDAEEPVFPSAGPSAAGLATQMDRPDEVVIGGLTDFHSAMGWRRRFPGIVTLVR